MKFNPYLTFNGDCKEAFTFYADLLGGKIEAMMPHAGTPAAEHVSPEWQDKIMHAYLTLGEQVLMASDSPPEHYRNPQGISVSLQVQERAEAERIFHALAENGTVTMPIQATFWSLAFGMCTDRFGIPWMVNCSQAPEGVA